MVNQTHPHRQPQLLGTTSQLIQKHPFILWGASLVLVLLLGGFALKGLIYPGPVEPEVATAPAKVPSPAPAKVPSPELQEQNLNLWLFSAVALGCAAGSIFISRRIERMEPKPQQAQPKSKQRAMPFQMKAAQKRQPATATRRPSSPMRRKKAAAVSVKRANAPATTVLHAEPVRMSQRGYPPNSVIIEPVVTVVPENESHPLDWGEASLAEMMDLRKQKPLSSLL
ncbi:hypothetical protein NDA01_04160 [Trichocoleus desertorum AS-A10]|uniref:hypothetical protein n=1 Tax=Trichocoleus desertorum TaxID=1481672 RepID=UPI0032996052